MHMPKDFNPLNNEFTEIFVAGRINKVALWTKKQTSRQAINLTKTTKYKLFARQKSNTNNFY